MRRVVEVNEAGSRLRRIIGPLAPGEVIRGLQFLMSRDAAGTSQNYDVSVVAFENEPQNTDAVFATGESLLLTGQTTDGVPSTPLPWGFAAGSNVWLPLNYVVKKFRYFGIKIGATGDTLEGTVAMETATPAAVG